MAHFSGRSKLFNRTSSVYLFSCLSLFCHSVSAQTCYRRCYQGHLCSHTHAQYGQHTQTAGVHNPWPGLMNGPSLNYFVQISFRSLKKRSSLFIHFTFAPRLQYLRLCLQRIYPPPIQGKKKL